MDTGQGLVIGLCVLLLVWYICGAAINYRRAGSVETWLKEGAAALGDFGGTGWLTALHSAAKIVIRQARAPFRAVELFFVLEARENLLVWIARHLLGRRDELVVRAELRSAPAEELDVARKSHFRNTTGPFDVSLPGGKSASLSGKVKLFLDTYSASVLRLSLRRKSPHVLVRIQLDPLRRKEARAFFSDLRTFLE